MVYLMPKPPSKNNGSDAIKSIAWRIWGFIPIKTYIKHRSTKLTLKAIQPQ